MNHLKSLLVFIAATLLFSTSCNRDKIDSLTTDVNKIKDLQIASIESQAEAISESVELLFQLNGDMEEYLSSVKDIPSDLSEISGKIKTELASIGEGSSMESSDILARLEALNAQIGNSKAIINTNISKLSGKQASLSACKKALEEYVAMLKSGNADWLETALSTLEQSRTLAKEITEARVAANSIDAAVYDLWESGSELKNELEVILFSIEGENRTQMKELVSSLYDELSVCRDNLLNSYASTIAEGLNSLEESSRSWVNNNLSAYYSISEIDAKLSNLGQIGQPASIVYLRNAISTLKNASEEEDGKTEDIRTALYSIMNEYGESAISTIEPIIDCYDRIYGNYESVCEYADLIASEDGMTEEAKGEAIANLKEPDKDNVATFATMNSLRSEINKDKTFGKNASKEVSKLVSAAGNIKRHTSTIIKDASAIVNSAITLADNSEDIEVLKVKLSSLESELSESYGEILEESINKLEGKLSSEITGIQTSLDTELGSINKEISDIEERLDTIEDDVKTIKDSIKDIQNEIKTIKEDLDKVISRIQSITVVPVYSDGSVGISASATINFEIYPKSVAESLVELSDLSVYSLDAVYTETKAAVELIPITILSQTCENGIISLNVKGDELSNDFYSGDISANARLHISSGASDISSAYFPLTFEANGNTMLSFSLTDGENSYPALGINKHVVSVCVPYGTDITRLVAEFKTDAHSVSVNGIPQISGANELDFSEDVVYTLSPKRGEEATYTVKVHKFNLPTVYIETPKEAAIKSKETWIAGTKVRMWHPDGTIEDLGSTSVKGRGNSTWANYPKKPYTFKFDKKTSVLGMPKDKRWNLLANFADRSDIRNSIGLALSDLTKTLDWASHGEHVELILNGSHDGLYFLCEHIKVSSDRVNIKEMKSGDTSEEAITGGYLIEFDTTYDEVNKFRTSVLNLPCQFKSPDDDVLVPEQFAYMQNYVNSIEELITGENISESGYTDLIDIDTFIDFFFVKEITYNKELSIPRSIYMNKDRGGKLKMGPVWDFDLDPFTTNQSKLRNKSSIWYKYLFTDPVFVARLKEKWAESKDDFLTVVDLIDELKVKLKDSADRDNEMWIIDESHKYYPSEDYQMSFDDATARLRSAVIKRIRLLDTTINSL